MPARQSVPDSTNQSHRKLSKLRDFYKSLKGTFHSSHNHASTWLQTKALDVEDFRQKSQHLLAVGTLAGTMAMHGQPVDAQVMQRLMQDQAQDNKNQAVAAAVSQEEREEVLNKLEQVVKQPPGHLPREDELYIEQQMSDMLGFPVAVELEGNRLNHSIMIMGGEQHLRRFPTDSLNQHDAFLEAGIAPGRGAFGWFTENGELTEKAIQREKYYFAVQTLYLPNWNTDWHYLKDWYKFRKMIVINPAERIAVVGVVGDAGPAQWVKKQSGGSPEIIREGKIWSPKSRGRVYMMFVDDPTDSIPLGVIDLNQLPNNLPVVAAADAPHPSGTIPEDEGILEVRDSSV